MDLQLVDLRRQPTDDRWWAPPFDWDVAYENEHWWSRPLGEDPWLVKVLENDVEVARVELDDAGGINPAYRGVPKLGDERLEIQFIEVAAAARGLGVGLRVVHALTELHRGRRFFAYSEADRFWVRVGWEPFYDPSPGPVGRTLFIQPAQ